MDRNIFRLQRLFAPIFYVEIKKVINIIKSVIVLVLLKKKSLPKELPMQERISKAELMFACTYRSYI